MWRAFANPQRWNRSRANGHVLTPGRYVGVKAAEEDATPFVERFAALQAELEEQFAEGERLTAVIRERLAGVVVDG